MNRENPNVRVICSSCANGEHMCGGDCDCVLCFMERMRKSELGVALATAPYADRTGPAAR